MSKLLESELAVGEVIDRYHLIGEIASGGMATVFLARLAGLAGFQRTVALKRLHPHLARNEEFVEMFLDEARLAALIHHPNVVPIQEVGQGHQGYYLVMDYIEGDTLAALLSRSAAISQRIPLRVSLRICIDMLHGLHAAHELRDERGEIIGLVHRDVSPQNVLVGTDGISRITDFGVARAASHLSATRAGQLKGKLAYMAPEQARGEEDVDRRTDIFAAGVVLWEALAFKRLFKADNHVATLSRVLSERIVSPRRLNSDVPESVAAVCLKALQRDPELRFASCLEFADALERVAQGADALATPREVAALVDELVGHDVETHRVAIRSWAERMSRVPEGVSLPPPTKSMLPPARSGRAEEHSSVVAQKPPLVPIRPPSAPASAGGSVRPGPPPLPPTVSVSAGGSPPPTTVPALPVGAFPTQNTNVSSPSVGAAGDALGPSTGPASSIPAPPASHSAVSAALSVGFPVDMGQRRRSRLLVPAAVVVLAISGVAAYALVTDPEATPKAAAPAMPDAPAEDSEATPKAAAPSMPDAPVEDPEPVQSAAATASGSSSATPPDTVVEDLPLAEPEPRSARAARPARASEPVKRPRSKPKKKMKLDLDNPYR